MAWRRPGDKPLSEPKMESFLMHICVTRPQWVKIDHWSLWLITAKRHVQRLWLPLFLTLQGLDKYHFWTTRKPVVLQTVYAVPIWIHVFVWEHLAYEWKSKYKMRRLIIAFNEKTHSLIWDVCFELEVWVTFCCYHYSTVSNIVINAVPIWIHVFVWGHLAYEWKSKYKMRTLIIAFNEKTNSLICAYIYVYMCVYIHIHVYVFIYMCVYIGICSAVPSWRGQFSSQFT